MRPVVIDPTLPLPRLIGDLQRAHRPMRIAVCPRSDRRQAAAAHQTSRRRAARGVRSRRSAMTARQRSSKSAPAAGHVWPSLIGILQLRWRSLRRVDPAPPRDGVYISEHPDELVSIEDDLRRQGQPGGLHRELRGIRARQLNAVPALIAAIQRPRELTRKELKELAILLDAKGFSEASLRRPTAGRATPISPRTSLASCVRPRSAIRWCRTRRASKTASSESCQPELDAKQNDSGLSASAGR